MRSRGQSIYVNAVWVFIALLVGVLLGAGVVSWQGAHSEDLCAYCDRPLSGPLVSYHEPCFDRMCHEALEQQKLPDPATLDGGGTE